MDPNRPNNGEDPMGRHSGVDTHIGRYTVPAGTPQTGNTDEPLPYLKIAEVGELVRMIAHSVKLIMRQIDAIPCRRPSQGGYCWLAIIGQAREGEYCGLASGAHIRAQAITNMHHESTDWEPLVTVSLH